MVTVAQLVEPRFVVPVVAGSSPVGHPISVALRNFIFLLEMEKLQQDIGYIFRDEALLVEALTHPSLAYENESETPDNQRLEFLGDAVLQLVLTNDLFERFPDFSEGLLTKLRSRLVSTSALEEYALNINLGNYGEFGTYSFYYSHQITSGEGGMVTCNNDKDYEILFSLRSHGWFGGARFYSRKEKIWRTSL